MKKTKRIPRRIGVDDEGETSGGDTSTEKGTAVKRPNNAKSKTSSTVRRSFVPVDYGDDTDNASVVKKPGIGRQGLDRSAHLKSLAADRIPHRPEFVDDRPSYTADYIAELKSSTPNIPQQEPSANTSDLHESLSPSNLDIAAKFGANSIAHLDQPSSIPTATEIQEKKERRRRLAKEHDFISLGDGSEKDSDSDDEANLGSHSLIIPAEELSLKDKYGVAESRLAHEDEDMAEGFDSFVEDPGRVTLGKRAAYEQERERRANIETQIRSAQPTVGTGMNVDEDDDDIDEEDATRNAAYEAAQTKFGTYGTRNTAASSTRKAKESSLQRRLHNVPKISPLPEWKAVMARFQQLVQSKDESLRRISQTLENNKREKEEIDQEEDRIQVLLKEAGQKIKMDQEKSEQKTAVSLQENNTNGDKLVPGEHESDFQSFSGSAAPRGVDRGSEVAGNPFVQGSLGVNLGLGMSGMAQIPQHDDYDSDE